MMFSLVKNPSPTFRTIFERYKPAEVVLSLVALAYPVWGIIGAIVGILYTISDKQAPGSGLGSPNLVFTIAILAVTVMMAVPFVLLLRQVAAGVAFIALASAGVFGWLVPYFAE
jgi:ABC-type methionine transport system permease subunit